MVFFFSVLLFLYTKSVLVENLGNCSLAFLTIGEHQQ